MDLTGVSLVITAVSAVLTTVGVAIGKAWRASVQRAALELQSRETIDAKNREIDVLKGENERLWRLLDGLTT